MEDLENMMKFWAYWQYDAKFQSTGGLDDF